MMEAMADMRPGMEAVDGAMIDSGQLWWKQSLDAAPKAALWIGTPEPTWMALGRQILTAAGVESSSTEEIRSSYLEVLRQSMSAFANALGSQLDREVLCTEGVEQAPPSNQSGVCRIAIKMGSETLADLIFRANQELLEAVSRAAAAAESPAASAGVDHSPDQDTVDVSSRVFNTLDLLLDVEMPVSVSFGRTQVRIQDILKLITGSIIELDRAISEPVEVIVNNCVIARGEVVVVEGNYGVRINEVMSRQQRLQESRRYLLPVHHR